MSRCPLLSGRCLATYRVRAAMTTYARVGSGIGYGEPAPPAIALHESVARGPSPHTFP